MNILNELEIFSLDEMKQIKGGDWVYIDGEWIWIENNENWEEEPNKYPF